MPSCIEEKRGIESGKSIASCPNSNAKTEGHHGKSRMIAAPLAQATDYYGHSLVLVSIFVLDWLPTPNRDNTGPKVLYEPSCIPILDREWSERVVLNDDLAGYETNCVIRLASFALDQKNNRKKTGALDDVQWAAERIRRFFPDRLDDIMSQARQIVEEHHDAIMELGALIHERRVLSAKEIAEFWKSRGGK